MRAASPTIRLSAVDEEQRVRERAESARTLAFARSAGIRASRVAAKVQRMTDLYRERLDGSREVAR